MEKDSTNYDLSQILSKEKILSSINEPYIGINLENLNYFQKISRYLKKRKIKEIKEYDPLEFKQIGHGYLINRGMLDKTLEEKIKIESEKRLNSPEYGLLSIGEIYFNSDMQKKISPMNIHSYFENNSFANLPINYYKINKDGLHVKSIEFFQKIKEVKVKK